MHPLLSGFTLTSALDMISQCVWLTIQTCGNKLTWGSVWVQLGYAIFSYKSFLLIFFIIYTCTVNGIYFCNFQMTLRGLALVTGHKHYAMHLPLEALTVSHICENNNIRRVYFEDRSVYARVEQYTWHWKCRLSTLTTKVPNNTINSCKLANSALSCQDARDTREGLTSI